MKRVTQSASVKRDMGFWLAFASLVVALAACGGSLVEPFAGGKAPVGSEPAGGAPSPAPPSPPPPLTPPPISPSGSPIYLRVSHSYIPGTQRYVFYDDASFGLQYETPDWGFFEYRGNYTRVESAISLRWNDAGAWTATGTVRGDSLIVEYSDDMLWSDFENGVYLLESK